MGHQFRAEDLSVKDSKKLLIGSIIPRPIGLVASQSAEGIVNLGAFSYFNVVSFDPPIVAISVIRSGGQMKDTARNIVDQGQAVIHMVTEDNVDKANLASVPFDFNESEVDFAGFSLKDSQYVDIPSVDEAPISLECRLHNHVEVKGDDGQVTTDLLLLRVEGYVMSDEVYDSDHHYIIADQLKSVSRLAGDNYSTLGDFFSKKRPDK